jgi:hypothetical protein
LQKKYEGHLTDYISSIATGEVINDSEKFNNIIRYIQDLTLLTSSFSELLKNNEIDEKRL